MVMPGDLVSLYSRLDLRSTMSSPRTGIFSLIRFNSGKDLEYILITYDYLMYLISVS